MLLMHLFSTCLLRRPRYTSKFIAKSTSSLIMAERAWIQLYACSLSQCSKPLSKVGSPARREIIQVAYYVISAGMTLDDVAGSKTSVFSGAFHRDYHDSLSRNPDALPRFLLTGNGTAMLSNRISHFFDLRGPSMTIDTGCSSSLTSLHTACRSLQAKDCDMSIVTGCNTMLNPDPFISMSGLGYASPRKRTNICTNTR